MTTLEVLKAAREKIADPEHWTQEEYLRDANNGLLFESGVDRACKFCSIGAVFAVLNRTGVTTISEAEESPAVAALDKAAGVPIYRFNDRHSHGEVIDVWNKAISAEESKSA